MNLTKLRANRLSWLLVPLLLFMALIAGALGIASTHAASPLDGAYNFRAITTAGPASGTYIKGQLSLIVGGSNTVTGQICALNVGPNFCSSIKGGTTDGTNVSFSFHVNTLPTIAVTGAYVSDPGGNALPAFFGTFTFGSSSGTWDARNAAAVTFDGSWNFQAAVQSGTDTGTQYHGVLNLEQDENNGISGTYCVAIDSCVAVSGSNINNTLVIYVNLGSTLYRLVGTPFDSHNGRIGGQFHPANDNSATADKGFWIGNTAVI